MIQHKNIAITAAIFGLLAVLLGAFGAHGLKDTATPETLESFNTGVRYQIYHALVLLFLSLLQQQGKSIKLAYRFILIGVILFSGSIYALSLASMNNVSLGLFALLTPLGGTCLIIGWAILLFWLFKLESSKTKI